MSGTALAVLACVVAVFLAWMLRRTTQRLHAAEQRAGRLAKESLAQENDAVLLRDSLLKGTDDALLVLDSSQTILYVNPSAETLFGSHLAGETLIGAIRQPALDSLLRDALRVHGESVERRVEFQHRIFHVRAIASNDDAEARYEVLVLRDVTELQRLERARREMVSNITHELSTPITSIGLLAETLISFAQDEKPKRVRKMAKDISREVHTLTQLVQEMRDLSLIESGQMPVKLTPSPLLPIVQSAVEQIQSLVEDKGLTVALEVPESIYVLADDSQIKRAVKNIAHNAVKYSPEKGTITITTTVSETEAVLGVSDEGPGIPTEDLSRVFERFFQVDRSRHNGTGLGLAIVRHIVMAHGGRAWIESEEGKGTTVFIALALADSPSQA